LKIRVNKAVNESDTVPRFLIGIKRFLDKINEVPVEKKRDN